MRNSNQEVNWFSVTGSSSGSSGQISKNMTGDTSSSLYKLGDFEFSSFLDKPDVTSQARKLLSTIKDEQVKNNANQLLILINSILQNLFGISELPPLKAYRNEDESIYFEWTFLHFRVGFSIETNIKDSGWFLTSDETAGGIMASGKILDGVGTERIVIWLLQFITLNF